MTARNKYLEWILGTVTLLIGTLYLVSVNPAVLGATPESVTATFAMSFLFYLITGYLWLGLAGSVFGPLKVESYSEEEVSTKDTLQEETVGDELAVCGRSNGC